jgi:hypothetical protein
MSIGGLNLFQDSQERSGPASVLCNRLVNQQLFRSVQHFIGDTLHDSSASKQTRPKSRPSGQEIGTSKHADAKTERIGAGCFYMNLNSGSADTTP